MSKLSFRARALDPAKPMPIYNSLEEPEILNPTTAISRAVLQLPTGMEKEEEEVGLLIPLGLLFAPLPH